MIHSYQTYESPVQRACSSLISLGPAGSLRLSRDSGRDSRVLSPLMPLLISLILVCCSLQSDDRAQHAPLVHIGVRSVSLSHAENTGGGGGQCFRHLLFQTLLAWFCLGICSVSCGSHAKKTLQQCSCFAPLALHSWRWFVWIN